MLVSELIEELSHCTPDAEVFVERDFQWTKAKFLFENEEWTQCHICEHSEEELFVEKQ